MIQNALESRLLVKSKYLNKNEYLIHTAWTAFIKSKENLKLEVSNMIYSHFIVVESYYDIISELEVNKTRLCCNWGCIKSCEILLGEVDLKLLVLVFVLSI